MQNFEYLIKKYVKDDLEQNENGIFTTCFSDCPSTSVIDPFSDPPKTMSVSFDTGKYHCDTCNCEGNIDTFIKNKGNLTDGQVQEELNNFICLKLYAENSKIPCDFLQDLGIDNGENTIQIPYYDENKNVIAVHEFSKTNGFKWLSGSKANIYGKWKLKDFKDNSYIILTIGEKNAHALWFHNIQALSIPGGVKFKEEYVMDLLDRFEKIYLIVDNSLISTSFIRDVLQVLPCDKLYKINPNKIGESCNTALDLHLLNKLNLKDLFLVAENVTTNSDENKENKTISDHVNIGKQLITLLNLRYYNDDLYTYQNGVYELATDKMLKHCIVHDIDINAKRSLCNESIEFGKNWLSNDKKIIVSENFVNCLNGLVNLETGELIPHTPKIFMLNQVHFNFIPDLPPNPLVDNYLLEIMCGNQIRVLALLQYLGYSCTSSTRLQKSMIWYGEGSNGKSVLSEIITNLIGMENISHVELQQFEQRFGTHEINQKLLNLVPELPTTKIKNPSTFKSVVTGDQQKADVKYAGRIDIQPYAKHIFSTNTLPQVNDLSEGFYRRLNILPFENKFDPATSNFNKQEFLKQENLDYLGSLAIHKYIQLIHSNNFNLANYEESNRLLSNYKAKNNSILNFLSDPDYQYIYGKDIPTPQMYALYKNHCVESRLNPLGKKEFFSELQNKYGFSKKHLNGGYTHFFKASNDLNID